MLKAASLWAWAKNTNQSTEDSRELAGDAILAAQTITLSEKLGIYTIIATRNVRDLGRYTHAATWEEITIEYCLNPKPEKIYISVIQENQF